MFDICRYLVSLYISVADNGGRAV